MQSLKRKRLLVNLVSGLALVGMGFSFAQISGTFVNPEEKNSFEQLTESKIGGE